MQEKKEPAKITWWYALCLVVVAVAISAFVGWQVGKDTGYQIGFDAGREGLQNRVDIARDSGYQTGYKDGVKAASSKTSSDDPYNIQERLDNMQQASEEQSQTVYITNTGEKYHRDGCQYLRQSKIAISLYDAKNQGYKACSRCW